MQWLNDNKAKVRAYRQRNRYGITYDEMLKKQNYCCAICGDPLDLSRNTTMDHKGEVVRGVLCRWCNSGIGFFKDDINRLIKAILYLKRQEVN